MPYDPTLPAANSPIVSAELRNQFAGLKELIDGKASGLGGIDPLVLAVSDPPTQSEVQRIADKLDDVINALNA